MRQIEMIEMQIYGQPVQAPKALVDYLADLQRIHHEYCDREWAAMKREVERISGPQEPQEPEWVEVQR